MTAEIDIPRNPDLPWGEITDETIADAAQMIGVELRRENQRWVNQANFDAMQHFVEGVGDRNPLYRDRDYGKGTRWGSILAHPLFFLAVDTGVIAPRMPGVTWIYAGVDWTLYDVVRLDDWFTTRVVFEAQQVKQGRFSERWVMQDGRVSYLRDPSGALAAESVTQIARTPRVQSKATTQQAKYEAREPYVYGPGELDAIERDIMAMKPRGSETRFWEDVEVGEELPPVIKGPLRSNDMVAWYAGTMGVRPYGGALEDAVFYRSRHRDFHIGRTGVRDSPGRGHLEGSTGGELGMGGAYDIGPQRVSWGVQVVTNWMGDDAFLHHHHATLRRPNLVGDTTWWRGTVRQKSVVEDYHLVTIDLVATNQLGEELATAESTAILASREHGMPQVPIPHALVSASKAKNK